MPDLPIRWDNGLDTANDELRLQPGFLRICRGAVYLPNDASRLYRMPGRTLAGALPTSTTVKDIGMIQYEGGEEKLLLFANSKLYIATAATSSLSWSALQDQTPADYAVTGSYMKVIHDGGDRGLVFTGATGERPLVIDEDGQARRLGLHKPASPTLAALTTAATETSPSSNSTPGSTDEGTPSAGFTNPNNAQDGDKTNFAEATASSATVIATRWEWTAGTTINDKTLFFKVASSSSGPLTFPPDEGDGGTYSGGSGGGSGSGSSEDLVAKLVVQVSTDNGSNFTDVFEQVFPIATTTVQFDISGAGTDDTSELMVQAIMVYTSGTVDASAYVYEIWIQQDTAGSSGLIAAGDYQYAVTEVYKKTLTDGVQILVESAPSDVTTITMDGATHRGVQITLPSQKNVAADGVATAQMTRRIYRSVTDGVWPNLGFIGEVSISASTYNDNFDVAAATLGSPTINVVTLGSATFHAAGVAPALRDATLFRGAIVGIPAAKPRRIRWSMPGQPEYWPFPLNDLALLSSDRNEEAQGIVSVNDVLLIFLRTKVMRTKDLPMAGRSDYDLADLAVDVLSPNEGLAGSPRSYERVQTQAGRATVWWVSDNGIWMTDGSLLAERGLGVVKVTSRIDWTATVDTARLDETKLTYDPVHQTVWFDYYDPDGNQRSLAFHTAPEHWVPSGQNQLVPKVTGPHVNTIVSRAVGEESDVIRHWTITTSNLYNERDGDADVAQFDGMGSNDLMMFVETGWIYPTGPWGEIMVFQGTLYHNDWGAGQFGEIEVLFRRDETGVVQTVKKKDVRMTPAATTRKWLSRSAQSLKARFFYKGQSSGAIGPLVLDVESLGQIERE